VSAAITRVTAIRDSRGRYRYGWQAIRYQRPVTFVAGYCAMPRCRGHDSAEQARGHFAAYLADHATVHLPPQEVHRCGFVPCTERTPRVVQLALPPGPALSQLWICDEHVLARDLLRAEIVEQLLQIEHAQAPRRSNR
jgi:hypothetical protein